MRAVKAKKLWKMACRKYPMGKDIFVRKSTGQIYHYNDRKGYYRTLKKG